MSDWERWLWFLLGLLLGAIWMWVWKDTTAAMEQCRQLNTTNTTCQVKWHV